MQLENIMKYIITAPGGLFFNVGTSCFSDKIEHASRFNSSNEANDRAEDERLGNFVSIVPVNDWEINDRQVW